MTVAMRTISGPLEDEERQKALFEGTLLIFKNVEHLATLCSFVDSMISLILQHGFLSGLIARPVKEGRRTRWSTLRWPVCRRLDTV